MGDTEDKLNRFVNFQKWTEEEKNRTEYAMEEEGNAVINVIVSIPTKIKSGRMYRAI